MGNNTDVGARVRVTVVMPAAVVEVQSPVKVIVLVPIGWRKRRW